MQARTWLQKLTDESSLWFNAVKAEDNGDFIEAASYYLNDAAQSSKERSSVRQALSVSCAANCLARVGATVESRQLFGEAARLYMKNADTVIAESIREALWSLEQAFENLILAGDMNRARELRTQYLAIAARKTPFSNSVEASVELDRLAKDAQKGIPIAKAVDLPPSLREQIQTTIKATQWESKEAVFSPSAIARSIRLDGGSRIDEKGIVS